MGRIYDDNEDDDDDNDDDDDRRTRRRRKRRDTQVDPGDSKRMAAALCALLVGGFGVHKFILGYNNEGIILLAITISGLIVGTVGGVCCIFPFVLLLLPMVSGVIAFVEGIIYLTKSDEEFIEIYQVGRKPWF